MKKMSQKIRMLKVNKLIYAVICVFFSSFSYADSGAFSASLHIIHPVNIETLNDLELGTAVTGSHPMGRTISSGDRAQLKISGVVGQSVHISYAGDTGDDGATMVLTGDNGITYQIDLKYYISPDADNVRCDNQVCINNAPVTSFDFKNEGTTLTHVLLDIGAQLNNAFPTQVSEYRGNLTVSVVYTGV